VIYFKTRVLKYITFTFVPATFELYQLGVPIRVKKRYILVLHGEVYRFRGPYKDDLIVAAHEKKKSKGGGGSVLFVPSHHGKEGTTHLGSPKV